MLRDPIPSFAGSQHIFCSSSPTYTIQKLLLHPHSRTPTHCPSNFNTNSYSTSQAAMAPPPCGIAPSGDPMSMAITVRLHRCVIHLQRPLRGLLLSTEPRLLLLSVEPRILMLENALTTAECEVRSEWRHIPCRPIARCIALLGWLNSCHVAPFYH